MTCDLFHPAGWLASGMKQDLLAVDDTSKGKKGRFNAEPQMVDERRGVMMEPESQGLYGVRGTKCYQGEHRTFTSRRRDL